MEKQTLEKKKIVHNNISYLQYDLPTDQAQTSFFDISDINTINDLRQEGLQKMHFLNLYSFFGSTQVKGLISLILMSTKLGKERFSSYLLNVPAHIVTSTM